MVVWHLDMGRAEELECVVARIGEARDAVDIGAFADAGDPLAAPRAAMMR